MNLEEQTFGYLMDIEEDKAAEIARDCKIQTNYIDVVMTELDEWHIIGVQILIMGKYLKEIDSTYLKEKKLIEDTVAKFAETNKQKVQHFSWLPLPRIVTELSKNNKKAEIKQLLVEGKIDDFFKGIKSIFASMSYNIKVTEAYFHSNIHMLLKTLGINIVSEDETNIGRIDSVIEFDDVIYIIEFKLSSPNIAIEQIKSKKYYEKYFSKGKKIFLVGVACNTSEKNISSWKVEEYLDS